MTSASRSALDVCGPHEKGPDERQLDEPDTSQKGSAMNNHQSDAPDYPKPAWATVEEVTGDTVVWSREIYSDDTLTVELSQLADNEAIDPPHLKIRIGDTLVDVKDEATFSPENIASLASSLLFAAHAAAEILTGSSR